MCDRDGVASLRRYVGVCRHEGCGKAIYSVCADYLPFCLKHNDCRVCGEAEFMEASALCGLQQTARQAGTTALWH
jgi:hypothetical protein